ncbi:type II toxin-antitoxin system VapC family toxin [Sulfurospirillum barnesii]|uniref:Putative nucleic acid-binding protein, contains PIN domain n=1 Tax=Sulfurospirillum barnesii (strain ATCC 700032 / DSM 10660 / SES-3) TaxID=760154 RepID=I3Y0C1_SULBS|nr:PIN domain-containing protein [Sulfurospirillum barnesii]AFL69645.1 putative nucleic acid-binding protein, contains PIN domain [Sulfurospirillum barnesii SES-3]
MRVLLDTNVVLDLLLDREPFSELAQAIFLTVESKQIQGFLCPTTLTTLYYLLSKHLNKKQCNQTMENLLALFEISTLTKSVLIDSVRSVGSDFEDSVIYTSAKHTKIDVIVTRDKTGFKNSAIKVMSPQDFLIFMDAN